MVVDMARIAQLERELEEARKELWKEDAERYRVLVREMPQDERKRIIKVENGPASHCRLGTWATRNANLAWSHH